MLLGFYFIKWGVSHNIVEHLYKDTGELSIHSFIKKCTERNCKEQLGDYFGVYTVLQIYKLILNGDSIYSYL